MYSSSSYTTKEDRIIEKYNRHWAIVLNPNDAKVGISHVELAKRSTKNLLQDDDNDAQPGGGVDAEMKRLVRFANAREGHVDHVRCVGEDYSDTVMGPEINHPTQVLYKDLQSKCKFVFLKDNTHRIYN